MNKWLNYSGKKLFWLSIICLGFPVLLWLLAIGTELTKRLPFKDRMNIKFFKMMVFYVFGYLIFAIFYFLTKGKINFPLHFIAVSAYLYVVFFAAKIIKSIEMKKEALLPEFSTDLFIIASCPFGIWLIQPRINNIISE